MRKRTMLDALFSQTRQSILSSLLLCPERKWHLSDLAVYLHVSPSTLQRELASLTEAGILHREDEGNRVYYQPNPAHPLLPELRSIFLKTTGLADKIRDALKPFWEEIECAFIFGSIARDERGAHSDIDLMLIGSIQMFSLALALRDLENALGAEVNVTLYTTAEYRDKLNQGNHFLKTVHNGQKIFLKGNEDELAILAGEPQNTNAHDK